MRIVLIVVFVFKSFFFVRILVFELLTILYFRLAYSDLGLRCLAGKQLAYPAFAKYAVDAHLFRLGRQS